MRQRGSDWLADHVEALAALLSAGKSTREAAIELSAMFGRLFTRNACVGKSHRLGISSGLTYIDGGKRSPHPPRRRRIRTRRMDAKPRLQRPLMACEPVPLHKKLVELGHGECKWPFGDKDFTFCAHTAIKISPEGDEKPYFLPYCAWHSEVASKGTPTLKPIELPT